MIPNKTSRMHMYKKKLKTELEHCVSIYGENASIHL